MLQCIVKQIYNHLKIHYVCILYLYQSKLTNMSCLFGGHLNPSFEIFWCIFFDRLKLMVCLQFHHQFIVHKMTNHLRCSSNFPFRSNLKYICCSFFLFQWFFSKFFLRTKAFTYLPPIRSFAHLSMLCL